MTSKKLRDHADQIINEAIASVLPDTAVRRALENMAFSGRVLLVAAGKAAWQMAKAASECLGSRIENGVVVTKYNHVKGSIANFTCYEAGHPVPDENSFMGTQAALDLTTNLTKKDTVLFLLSGGGSALFEKPLIFFAYDLDNYFDWRGFYYNYDELAPGPVCKTNHEMIDYIKNIDTRFDKEAVKEFRNKFMRSCDGNATKRILESTFDNLEAHRKPCEKFEHYYDVPRVQSSSMPYHKMIQLISEEKDYAIEFYNNAIKAPVVEGSVIAFDIQSKEIRTSLEQLRRDNMTIVSSGDSLDDALKEIATANYIIIDQVNPFLDCLDIREETTVILLASNAFPLNLFGKVSKEFRSGLRREQYELATLYASVDAVVAPSEETAELYKKAIGENVEAYVLGDIKSDILFNTKIKRRLLNNLYKRCPRLKGKRIISFFQKEYDEALDVSLIHEYLSSDYAFLEFNERVNLDLYDEEKRAENYAQDSVVDVSLLFTKYELMAISDIIVGGLDSYVYSAMATDKPVIIYSKNAASDMLKTESFVDIAENSPTPVYGDIYSVINVIRDIDNYDYTKYKELQQKYLKKCDGRSAKRLLNKLI